MKKGHRDASVKKKMVKDPYIEISLSNMETKTNIQNNHTRNS
jgi:hypothetical protein